LKSLSADFLLENVRLAHQSRRESAFSADVPEDVFLNYVLPYVNLNEDRERWRQDFYDRYFSLSQKSADAGAAAERLNELFIKDFELKYDIDKRPQPDQSPYQTIAVKVASCTGLSILYSDILRSVGIPARVVGTPQWTDKSGNHTWVEVWSKGQWHHLGAGEEGGLNEAWFNEKASQADPEIPEHRIYAASFKRTDMLFPTIWDPFVDYVFATDVTQRYLKP
jgi:Transglutaminase-like enzymes, putative cysteine proteases